MNTINNIKIDNHSTMNKIAGLKPLYNSLLQGVGNTPLVRLNHLSKEYNCEIYGKIESFNPSMSIKDRVVNYIINKAEICSCKSDGLTK